MKGSTQGQHQGEGTLIAAPKMKKKTKKKCPKEKSASGAEVSCYSADSFTFLGWKTEHREECVALGLLICESRVAGGRPAEGGVCAALAILPAL